MKSFFDYIISYHDSDYSVEDIVLDKSANIVKFFYCEHSEDPEDWVLLSQNEIDFLSEHWDEFYDYARRVLTF